MSETERTSEEYVGRYADVYCGGNVKEAREHAIVREVLKQIQEKGNDKR